MPIVFKGVKPFNDNLIRLSKYNPEPSIVAGSKTVQRKAKRNIRRKLRKQPTGQLERDVTVLLIDRKNSEIGVQADAKSAVYAKVHEFGKQGIRPVNAQALFIPLKRGIKPNQPNLVFGEDFVFAQNVNIPMRAWLRPAVDVTAKNKKIQKAMGESLRIELKGVVRII